MKLLASEQRRGPEWKYLKILCWVRSSTIWTQIPNSFASKIGNVTSGVLVLLFIMFPLNIHTDAVVWKVLFLI